MSDALFQSQGAPYGNFKVPGTIYEGTVVATGQVQSRKFNPKPGEQGELEFWPDQRPKMTAIITLQTTQRDPQIEGDDGQRSLWVKGKSMTDSVKAALRKAGASRRGIELGGYLSMTFTHETPNDWGGNPTKHYTVEYTLPENNPQRAQAQTDPWANVQAPDDFLVAPGTPVYTDPSQMPAQRPPNNINIGGGAPVPAGQFQGAQGASGGAGAYAQVQPTMTVPATPAPVQPVQPTPAPVQPVAPVVPPAAPNPLAGLDLDSMSPEARAALATMLAQQQGGQQ